MFLAKTIFNVSHLKIQPAVHLNISEALTSLQSKRKVKNTMKAFEDFKNKKKKLKYEVMFFDL